MTDDKKELGTTRSDPPQNEWDVYSSNPFYGRRRSRIDSLPPVLKSLAQSEVQTSIHLLEGWKKIHDLAATGRPIFAADFNKLEEKYNIEMARITPTVKWAIHNEVAQDLRAGGKNDGLIPSLGKAVISDKGQGMEINQDEKYPGFLTPKDIHSSEKLDTEAAPEHESVSAPKRLIAKAKDSFDQIKQKFKQAASLTTSLRTDYELAVAHEAATYMRKHPEIIEAVRDNEPLNKAFRKQYLKNAPKANIDLTGIDPNGTDHLSVRQQVVDRFLSKNPSISILDVHVFDEAPNIIKELIPTFKSQKVDTVYLEFPDKLFRQLESLSSDEMRQLLRDRIIATKDNECIKIPSAEEMAKIYYTKISDDSLFAWVDMIATLRENGIRVVNIDKKGPVREFEAHTLGDHRLSTTNFTWFNNIKDDRIKLYEELNAKGEIPGKYVVFGGAGHFSMQGNVDAALGTPSIAFTKGDPETGPAFKIGNNPSGATVYFPGGKDYIDMEKLVASYDIQAAAERLKHLPGLSVVHKALNKFAENLEQEALDSVSIKPEHLVSQPSDSTTAKTKENTPDPNTIPQEKSSPPKKAYEQQIMHDPSKSDTVPEVPSGLPQSKSTSAKQGI